MKATTCDAISHVTSQLPVDSTGIHVCSSHPFSKRIYDSVGQNWSDAGMRITRTDSMQQKDPTVPGPYTCKKEAGHSFDDKPTPFLTLPKPVCTFLSIILSRIPSCKIIFLTRLKQQNSILVCPKVNIEPQRSESIFMDTVPQTTKRGSPSPAQKPPGDGDLSISGFSCPLSQLRVSRTTVSM